MLLRLNHCTDFNAIRHEDTLIIEEELKQHFMTITDIHDDGAADETSFCCVFI